MVARVVVPGSGHTINIDRGRQLLLYCTSSDRRGYFRSTLHLGFKYDYDRVEKQGPPFILQISIPTLIK